ncbi:hypothetical protein KR026_010694 [Drosophila bipectinata]|nr:hypothetical protein KR026_010694 [Drosophila bipectinata]
MTPYKAWFGKKPSVSHLKVFGTKEIVLDKTMKRKIFQKGIEHILVGYSETANAYRLFNPDTQTIKEARDVVFLEHDIAKSEDISTVELAENGSVFGEEINGGRDENDGDHARDKQSEAEDSGQGRPKIICTGRPGRPRKEYNMLNAIDVADVQVPSGVKEALSSTQAEEWKVAMQKEYSQLQFTKT